MNVSMTEVATTMRTRLATCGFRGVSGIYVKQQKTTTNMPLSFGACSSGHSTADVIFSRTRTRRPCGISFRNTLRGPYGGNDDHRYGAEQARKKQIFKDRKKIMDDKVHLLIVMPPGAGNQRILPVC